MRKYKIKTYYKYYIQTDLSLDDFINSIMNLDENSQYAGLSGFTNSKHIQFKNINPNIDRNYNYFLDVEEFYSDGIKYITCAESVEGVKIGDRETEEKDAFCSLICKKYNGMMLLNKHTTEDTYGNPETQKELKYGVFYEKESKEYKLINKLMKQFEKPKDTFVFVHKLIKHEEIIKESLSNKCEFCSGKWKQTKIGVETSYADDNVCEERECEECDGCSIENQYFTIQIARDNQLQLTYRHNVGDLIISPISEYKKIKYCPECGRKL